MSMTRKDFVAIAQVFEYAKTGVRGGGTAEDMHKYLANGLADVLAGTNAAFDRGRFLTACGL